KATGTHIARGPGEVTEALEPEHRIIDIEGDHREVGGRVRGARRDERRHRPLLGDPFLEHLAFGVLAVVHELAGILRPVALADLAVDTYLTKQPFHAERAAFVGDDRYDAWSQCLVAQ